MEPSDGRRSISGTMDILRSEGVSDDCELDVRFSLRGERSRLRSRSLIELDETFLDECDGRVFLSLSFSRSLSFSLSREDLGLSLSLSLSLRSESVFRREVLELPNMMSHGGHHAVIFSLPARIVVRPGVRMDHSLGA